MIQARTGTAPSEPRQSAEPPAGVPITMREAVGYDAVTCQGATPADNAIVLKHDRLFLMINERGDITPPGQCSLGLFRDDTRALSHYALRVCGGPPSLLGTQALQLYTAQIDLAVNNLTFGGNAWDPKNCIHIRRELVVTDRLIERLTVTNYLVTPIEYWLALDLGCDFADIFEVRGWRRERAGQFYAPWISDRAIAFRYRGADAVLRRSSVTFQEPPSELTPFGARWTMSLAPRTPFRVEWQVDLEEVDDGTPSPLRRPRLPALEGRRGALDREYQHWRVQCTRWRSDVAAFNGALRQAVDDLRALYITIDGSEVISAGIPWYSTVFGRDSVIASLQTLPLNPRIALDTLRFLAAHQGTREDDYTEQQPGKIMHEVRRGELARSGEIPHVPYYGSVDATPLWLVLLHETWRWTGDDALVRELLPNAERALEWIDRYGDADGDGFVEYTPMSPKGLRNQGWKDSGDGVPYPDGTLPEPPIALVEVQGYVSDAKIRMASLFDAMGQPDRATRLRIEGEQLRQAILSRFWREDLGTFALALDGRKTPIPAITTNAGHLLWSHVPEPRQAERMTSVLLGADMFSGWGIRTLSAGHPVFNPMSYHNGSVWPHDNALVVLGLAIYGQGGAAIPVLRALYEATTHSKMHRLPELYCGQRREHGMHPVRYPVSCSPQAWASGALFMLLQAALGLFPQAPERVLHIRNPQLPDFLNDLSVTGLAIGRSRVSLRFRRYGERTLANLLAVDGEPLRVQIELD